jgi:uncharacterized membrane protein
MLGIWRLVSVGVKVLRMAYEATRMRLLYLECKARRRKRLLDLNFLSIARTHDMIRYCCHSEIEMRIQGCTKYCSPKTLSKITSVKSLLIIFGILAAQAHYFVCDISHFVFAIFVGQSRVVLCWICIVYF